MKSVASSLSSGNPVFLLTEPLGQSTFWNETPAFILPDLLPPISTDLNPIDPCSDFTDMLRRHINCRIIILFIIKNMGEMQQRVLSSSWCRWTEAAVDRCLASFQAKRNRWRSWWVAQVSLQVNLCERNTFRAFNLTPIIHMSFCILLMLWTLMKRYCVKWSRISPVSFSYISQGSAATHLRYGGQRAVSFVANFMENTTVKEFWKSANICQSYEQM